MISVATNNFDCTRGYIWRIFVHDVSGHRPLVLRLIPILAALVPLLSAFEPKPDGAGLSFRLQ